MCVASSMSEYFCTKTPTPAVSDILFVSALKLQYFAQWGLLDVIPWTCRKQLLWGKYLSRLCTVCTCVCYCEGLEQEVCVTAARLMWGAAQAGRFDWTPGCVHALSPSELNLANSWLKGLLPLLECLSFISAVKTKRYPTCNTLLMTSAPTSSWHHPAIKWFHSRTWPHSIPTSVIYTGYMF